jgi:hypothetical protein
MLPAIRAGLPADASDDDVVLALFCPADKISKMKEQPRDELPVRALSPLGALVGHLARRKDICRLEVRIDARG